MQERQPSVPASACDEEEGCKRCPINDLEKLHEQDIWHGVVETALKSVDAYGPENVRLQWAETGMAVRQEARQSGEDAGAKSVGSVAALACLRIRMGRDFKKLKIEP